jgi:hypothetical protein
MLLWVLGLAFPIVSLTVPASAQPLWSLDDPTFSFVIETDTIEYTDGDTTYAFHGVVQNLLNSDQNLIYTLTPFSFPHARRRSSICTYQGCYSPNEGIRTRTVPYAAMQNDTSVSFDIYNSVVTDIDPAFQLPITGNYVFDVRIHAQGAPLEFIEYRFYLNDLGSAVEPRPVPVPLSHQLLSNYPNPFNPSTNIDFVVEQTGPVELTVFDILGRTVADLVNANYTAGSYSLYWDATSNSGVTLPSGSYWVYLNTPSQKVMHRIVLLR